MRTTLEIDSDVHDVARDIAESQGKSMGRVAGKGAATYHFRMGRLFIIFLIVLLPLRGWAGDLMSVHMETSGLAPGASSVMAPDCSMRSAPAAANSASDADDPALSSGMESCTSCDLCLPIAELPDAGRTTLGFAAHAKPLTSGIDFASAPLAPAMKPPIF